MHGADPRLASQKPDPNIPSMLRDLLRPATVLYLLSWGIYGAL